MNCAVIGSGIGGLAAAIRLRVKGLDVDVFEANDKPGGKLQERRINNYRFDLGPSVFTMPHLIDELFVLAGKNPRDYFSYTRLDPSFKYFYADGSVINAYAEVKRFEKELIDHKLVTESRFEEYLKDVEAKFDITNEVFIENSLHQLKNYFTLKVLYGILHFAKIDAFKSMDEGNKKFFDNPKTVQLFNHYASYVGSNPLEAPATLNLISYLVMQIGAYAPDNGMYSLVNALVKLAEDIGVRFHYNARVEEIVMSTSTSNVTGIRLSDGREITYDRIVSNMDVYYTYKNLLPHAQRPKKILAQPKSSSVIAFYWGIKGHHPVLDFHNMLFAKDEAEEYNAVFKRKNISDDPSVYICITSRHVKEDAPAGCENWFILVTAPHDEHQDWNEIVNRTRKNVLKKISDMLSIKVQPLIEFEEVLTPMMIKEKYQSAFGSVYGNSSNNKFAAFLRHPNFSRKIKGLYFVGGSVHPGAGIPMCLNSAKIVEKVFR
jgi:phytoene desaturase